MRVASIPSDFTSVTPIKVALPDAMKNKMRLSFYKEGDTFQKELEHKARLLKTDVFELYTSLLFYKVYEARTKFIDQRREANLWDAFYTMIANGVPEEVAKRQLGLSDEGVADQKKA